ncbi:15775_t:CDS:2 [Rhizophagus irregularis]|nr:15775_t:CDS:2 [Rhizophagus irregularis]
MSEQYFQQQEIKSSSLVDFDNENASEEEISAARGLIKAKKVSNFKPVQHTVTFLSVCIADDLKFAGSLWKNLDLLRKIHEGFKDDEGADSREKTYEERERELSLREREMALREREASVRALELSNMEKELELKALEN